MKAKPPRNKVRIRIPEEDNLRRSFKHTKDGHNKFWDIEVSGNSYTTTYGRIGAEGTSSTKTFSSGTEAAREAEKIVQSKTKKGYEETTVAKKYASDSTSLEGRINGLLSSFSLKYDAELTYIEDCVFRGKPRSMEYEAKHADDPEMKPLLDLALRIDSLILETPRHLSSISTSPYVRDCAYWYKNNWDPLFNLEIDVNQLVKQYEEHGRSITAVAGGTILYAPPVGRLVMLPDRVVTDKDVMTRLGDEADVGQVWITADGRGSGHRFVKISDEAWYQLP